MIKFEGQVSKSCQRYISGQEAIPGVLGAVIGVVLVIIPATVAATIMMPLIWYLVVLAGVLFAALFIGLAYASPFFESTFPRILPTSITISDDGTITSRGQDFELTMQVENFNALVDMGDWYVLSWSKNPKRLAPTNARFVCQKDLLTEGSIKQLEKLFEGKIVRDVK